MILNLRGNHRREDATALWAFRLGMGRDCRVQPRQTDAVDQFVALSIIWGALLLATNFRYHDERCSAPR